MVTRGVADRWPVLLGGAALTRAYVEGDLRQVYRGRVFYCRDAFAGLKVMDQLREERVAGVQAEREPVRAYWPEWRPFERGRYALTYDPNYTPPEETEEEETTERQADEEPSQPVKPSRSRGLP